MGEPSPYPPAAPVSAGTALLAWLRAREGEMAELVARLAAAESPSTEPETQRAPFAILAEHLEEAGLRVSAVAGDTVGDHLLAEPADRDPLAPAQLLLGHMDTVWPLGTIEQMPVRIAGGRLAGPGVYDMKAGLALMIFALRALRAHDLEPGAAPVVFVTTDEELGSPESGGHVRRLARAAVRALVLEPSFGPSGQLKTARKGVGRFRLRVRGRASHAGINPEEGASAILEASHQIQRLFALNDRARGITVNVGTVDGGVRPNVVAPEVTAAIDARVVRAEDAAAVEHAILALRPVGEGIDLEVEGGFDRPPLERTARNRRLWALARRAAAELEVPIGEAAVGGASDGNLASLHTATLDGLGAVGDGAHAPHEHVILARLPERAALLSLLLRAPADGA
jgi:glutamate carboxypeptidase